MSRPNRIRTLGRVILLGCAGFGTVTLFAYPREAVVFAPQMLVEGSFLAVSVGGLVALPRLASSSELPALSEDSDLFTPFLVGFGGYCVRGVTDVLDEVLAVPAWYLSVFKDGALVVGSLAFVAGLYWWSRERRERERRLQERERDLQRQNQRLETFASVVSHDLRNPLTVAQGYAELLAADGSEDAEEVLTSLDRMEAIIEDVLELARLGADAVEPAPVELGTVAEGAWSEVDTSGATLSVEQPETVVHADEGLLQQLLENVFRNAVEHGSTAPTSADWSGAGCSTVGEEDGGTDPDRQSHADDGDGALTVRVGPTETGFRVADDGQGIPEAQRADVLELGHTTEESGTGLGLAIVAEIADAHGWTVSVGESEAGGARFEFGT